MASDYELKLILSAKDALSGVLNDVKGNMGELQKAGGALGHALGTGLKVAAGAAVAGVGALAGGLIASVKAAADAELVMAQLDAVLKSTGGAAGVTREAALDLADALSGLTRYDDEAILGAENLLLTFTNIGKDVFPDVTEVVLDMSTAMGQDLKSSAVMVGKALQDPIIGASALRRVGVNLTESQVDLIKALVESGQAADAQALILKELQTEFGGSAKAAGKTLAGQLDILKTKFGNVMETIGAALLPALTKLASGFNDLLANPAVQAGIQAVADGIADMALGFSLLLQGDVASFGELMANAFYGIGEALGISRESLDRFYNGIGKVAGFITGTAIPALKNAWAFIQDNLTPILAALAAALMLVVVPAFAAWAAGAASAAAATLAAIAPIAAPILAIIAAVALLAAAWESDFGGIRTTLTAFWNDSLQPIFETIKTWLETNIPIALQTLSAFWTNTLLPALQTVWAFVQNDLAPLFTAVGEVVLAALSLATTALAGLWQNVLLPALQSVWKFIQEKILPAFQGATNSVNTALGPALKWLNEKVLVPVGDAFRNISGHVQKVVDWLNQLRDKLTGLKLPAWLTPGSPTPFELGLRGIGDALQTVNAMPVLDNVASTGAPANIGGPTLNITVNAGGATGRDVTDAFEMQIIPQILRALRDQSYATGGALA